MARNSVQMTATYAEYETILIELVRASVSKSLADIVRSKARRAYDDLCIRHGLEPVYNPRTEFDDGYTTSDTRPEVTDTAEDDDGNVSEVGLVHAVDSMFQEDLFK